MALDDLDRSALRILVDQARVSWADLASQLGLSPPAAAERVRRLEAAGVVLGFSARLRPEAVGRATAAFIAVTLERPEHRDPFLEWVRGTRDVLECHHVAGEGDYLLKVRVPDLARVEDVISNQIKRLPGIVATRTTIVLSTLKEDPLTANE